MPVVPKRSPAGPSNQTADLSPGFSSCQRRNYLLLTFSKSKNRIVSVSLSRVALRTTRRACPRQPRRILYKSFRSDDLIVPRTEVLSCVNDIILPGCLHANGLSRRWLVRQWTISPCRAGIFAASPRDSPCLSGIVSLSTCLVAPTYIHDVQDSPPSCDSMFHAPPAPAHVPSARMYRSFTLIPLMEDTISPILAVVRIFSHVVPPSIVSYS